MKKKHKMKIVVVGFLVVFIIVVLLNWKNFLFKYSSYRIHNEKGENLPITLFKRNINHAYGKTSEPVYEEIIVWFDDGLNMGMENVIIVFADRSGIAYPGRGKKSFFKLGGLLLFQKEHDHSNELQNLLNHEMYKNSPIRFFNFEDNRIMFNTYGDLKKYGDTVFIEMLVR